MSSSSPKLPGRPSKTKDPYADSNPLWSPGHTSDWFEPSRAPKVYNAISLLPPGGSLRQREIALQEVVRDTRILIEQAGVTVTRRWLEAVLVHDHGNRPDDVTKAIARFDEDSHAHHRVHVDFWAVGPGEIMQVYTYDRSATEAESEALVALVRVRQRFEQATVIVPYQGRMRKRNALGHAMERFTGCALVASRRYHVPTRVGRLGLASSTIERDSVDLIAVTLSVDHGIAGGVRYGVEVKNEREWVYRLSGHFWQVREAADAANLEPWLIVPFAVPEAVARAQKDNIKLTILRTRIAPKMMLGRQARLIIEELRPVIGPEPWAFIGDRFKAPEGWTNPF